MSQGFANSTPLKAVISRATFALICATVMAVSAISNAQTPLKFEEFVGGQYSKNRIIKEVMAQSVFAEAPTEKLHIERVVHASRRIDVSIKFDDPGYRRKFESIYKYFDMFSTSVGHALYVSENESFYNINILSDKNYFTAINKIINCNNDDCSRLYYDISMKDNCVFSLRWNFLLDIYSVRAYVRGTVSGKELSICRYKTIMAAFGYLSRDLGSLKNRLDIIDRDYPNGISCDDLFMIYVSSVGVFGRELSELQRGTKNVVEAAETILLGSRYPMFSRSEGHGKCNPQNEQ